MMYPTIPAFCFTLFLCLATQAQEMDRLWGDRVVKLRAEDAQRGQLFEQGNYAMFIHWGLYSQLANRVDGKTYYGIGEWIMSDRMAGIPVEQYKQLAGTFNPVDFDAKSIVSIAKDAGMKYVVITAKHHDGFAMYGSKVNDFNVVDATPWGKDPMKDLAAACREAGLGFGFYYSHNQDWTFPGGGRGPKVDADGNAATFDDYFTKKCLPQVKEITTQYGPIEIVWFDTPGSMPKHYVEELVKVVHENQPRAMVSGRSGHGLGDYQTLGDMEVPRENIEGLWESVDTTNDSWAYAWYDQCWKSPREILKRLIACVGRGGTYMLNIGPRGEGSVPERAVRSLRQSGDWIRRYPQVIYGADSSPWGHALPWGDITCKGDTLFLCVFDWPATGDLHLPNLKTEIQSASLLNGQQASPVDWVRRGDHVVLKLPPRAPESLVSVVELKMKSPPQVDPGWSLDPSFATEILAEFAEVENAQKSEKRWMEKFGEWKSIVHAHDLTAEGKVAWEVDVIVPGDYNACLTYSGSGRLVWSVEVEGGERIQNQQNSSQNYQKFPVGWIHFPRPGRYTVSVRCIGGESETASLKSIEFKRI